MIFTIETPFIQRQKVELLRRTYPNGRPAWQLVDLNGDPILTATVNIPEVADPRLDAGTHVVIKDWSENSGVLAALIDAGLIGRPIGVISTGFCRAPLCPVL